MTRFDVEANALLPVAANEQEFVNVIALIDEDVVAERLRG